MTTMSDEAAKKIAESTAKKYADAGRNVLVLIGNNNNTSAAVCSNMNSDDVVKAVLGLICELAGDSAETVFKDAAKQVKQSKKAEAKNAKRKKNA